MTFQVVITLTDEQKARLEQIAEAREETLVSAVEEAVTAFLHRDEEYRKYVQEGLDDIAAGRTRPWEEVEAELREKYGDFDD
jgi:predicted transcriptional regulator